LSGFKLKLEARLVMAGDWIKVEKVTPDKQEIRLIARSCGVSLAEAFTAWFRLWCWLDGETDSGHMNVLTATDCDDLGRLVGLGNALVKVGWIEFFADGGAILINWDRHNGESAKKRALAFERKRHQRSVTQHA